MPHTGRITPSTSNEPLPPGWDTKFDPRTGRYYFINHYTKSTSWEDPRIRYQQIGRSSSAASGSTSTTTNANKKNDNLHHRKNADENGGRKGLKIRNDDDDYSTTTSITLGGGASSKKPLKGYPIGTAIPPSGGENDSISGALSVTAAPAPIRRGIGGSAGAGTGIQASPLPLQRLQLEEAFNIGSPMSQRSSLRRESHVLADISEDGTFDLAHQQALSSIAAMFPTVDENHIRDLLKKYHGSQAVVISALQVAKHPFITPGPGTSTPPPTRHSTLPGVSSGVLAGIHMTGSLPHYYKDNVNNAGTMTTPLGMMGREPPSASSSGYPTPRPGSAASAFDTSFMSVGSPQIGGPNGRNPFLSIPRPHSSPKMKLRYLKSVFPTVEEYLLLDVLSNSDNNVQKGSDRLVKMGYVKRDTPSAPRLHARRKEEERLAEKRTPLPKPPPIKSEKEKEDLRRKMKDKYEKKFDIPERILFMALESVLFDEDQAINLINAMIEDDMKRKKKKEEELKEKKKSPKPTRKALEVKYPVSPKHEPKKRTDGKSSDETDFSPITIVPKANGPNPGLRKGPNDDLLLTDYVTWNGPNPDLRKSNKSGGATGPNPEMQKGPNSQYGRGSNYSLAKGPSGNAKGSMYQKLLMEKKQKENQEQPRIISARA